MTGKCTGETLKKAKENIKARFKFIAPSTEVDIVMGIVAQHFGVSNIAYAQSQVTGMKSINTTNHNLESKLREKHKYDVELFLWVEKEWSRWKNENIESISYNYNLDKSYLVIMPDFSKTKTPQKLSAEQISRHNEFNGDGIISLEQKHGGLSNVDKLLTNKLNKILER